MKAIANAAIEEIAHEAVRDFRTTKARDLRGFLIGYWQVATMGRPERREWREVFLSRVAELLAVEGTA